VLCSGNDHPRSALRLAARRSRHLRNAWTTTIPAAFQFRPGWEHALAFVLIGLAFGLAYPRNRLFTVGVSVVMIGVLELLQLWIPGRHARLEDFVVDAVAASAGFMIIATLDLVTAWSRRSSPGAS
jgi:hypothetical protein